MSIVNTSPHHHQSFVKHSKHKNDKSKKHDGTCGGIDTTTEWAYKVRPQIFLSFLSTDYSNSTMSMPASFPASSTLTHQPLLTDQLCLDVVSVIESCGAAHHPHDAIETLGCMLCTLVTSV